MMQKARHEVSETVIRNHLGQNLEVLEEIDDMLSCKQRAARLATDML